MADPDSMTVSEAAGKMLTGEHADVLREAVRLMLREIMEAEVAELAGGERYERSEERSSYRNGYRERRFDTRVGSLELAIPRLRSGSYFPSFLEPRRRSEQALVAVVAEAYVNGVSTRKVERLAAQLGIESMSRSTVSRLCRVLDEQVRIFRERPLEGRYPYLWLDAKVERVREGGGVRHKALVVAYGVHETGRREVIGIDVGQAETEAFWREFLRGLLARGLDGVLLCVSDAHEGLKKAIAQVLGCPWQRCTVHFLRDMQGMCTAASSRWSRRRSARSSRPTMPPRRAHDWPAWSPASRRRRPRWRCCSRPPRKNCWPSWPSRLSTGRSYARPTPWSA